MLMEYLFIYQLSFVMELKVVFMKVPRLCPIQTLTRAGPAVLLHDGCFMCF